VKRGWWRTTAVVVSLLMVGSTALAQSEPSVEPVVPAPAPYAAPPPPAPYYVPPRAMGPARLRYEDGDPMPPCYRVVHRTRQGPVIAGMVMFLVAYGISASVAMVDDFKHETNWLMIPVAGPWLMMYHRSQPVCDSETGNGCVERSLETMLRIYLAIDGAVQAAGVGLLGYGLTGRNILIRDGSYASVRLMPAPIGSTGYGATLLGRF
jgi:hypothetical protein